MTAGSFTKDEFNVANGTAEITCCIYIYISYIYLWLIVTWMHE